jgi:hypothetical protein
MGRGRVLLVPNAPSPTSLSFPISHLQPVALSDVSDPACTLGSPLQARSLSPWPDSDLSLVWKRYQLGAFPILGGRGSGSVLAGGIKYNLLFFLLQFSLE